MLYKALDCQESDFLGKEEKSAFHFCSSVRPKGLTAERFGRNFGEITAETFSALLSGFGHSAEREFSAENGYFGRKLPVSAKS